MEVTARQTAADRFARGVNAGLAGSLALAASALAEQVTGDLPMWNVAIKVIGLVLISYGLVTAINDRRSDEFTLSLWHSGTTLALVAFAFAAVFLPAVAVGLGVPRSDIGAARLEWEAIAVCFAFFATMRWRMRGGSA